jgi:hypothetical protein
LLAAVFTHLAEDIAFYISIPYEKYQQLLVEAFTAIPPQA